jgi:pilus assembly protein Flp/PilA
MMYLSALRAQTRSFVGKFVKNEKGVTAIEYAIVAAGVAGICLVIFKNQTGGPVYDMMKKVFDDLKTKVTSMMTVNNGG